MKIYNFYLILGVCLSFCVKVSCYSTITTFSYFPQAKSLQRKSLRYSNLWLTGYWELVLCFRKGSSLKVVLHKKSITNYLLNTIYSKFFYYSEYKYVNTIGDVVCGLFLVQPNKDSPILLVALEKSQYRSRLEDPNHIVELFYQTSNTQK